MQAKGLELIHIVYTLLYCIQKEIELINTNVYRCTSGLIVFIHTNIYKSTSGLKVFIHKNVYKILVI